MDPERILPLHADVEYQRVVFCNKHITDAAHSDAENLCPFMCHVIDIASYYRYAVPSVYKH
jgi:hypothetical protein